MRFGVTIPVPFVCEQELLQLLKVILGYLTLRPIMRVFLELLAFCLVSLSPAVARPNSISRSSSSWSDGKLPDWMHDVANPGSKEEFIPGTLAVRDARVMNTIEQWTDYVAEVRLLRSL